MQKKLCQGVEIYITDAEIYRAALTGANILRCIEELYPDKVVYPARYGGKGYKIDIALGETALRVGGAIRAPAAALGQGSTGVC